MSLTQIKETSKGDEYYTPPYVVEVLLPYLKQHKDIKTIWCPCDKPESEFVKVLSAAGYKVVYSHIETGHDFLTTDIPLDRYDAIVTNPPFSIKNKIINKCNKIGKPWALLLSGTCIQSKSLVAEINQAKDFNFIIFDKRISFDGGRPNFPSWFFTSQLLSKNEFYIFDKDPKELYKEWQAL